MSLQNIDPISHPNGWDYVTIGGVHSPPCKVDRASRKNKWDVKDGKGAEGGFTTYVGKPPMQGIKCTFLLWDNGERSDGVYYPDLDHFAQWDAFLPLLRYDPTKKSVQALDFYHPSFDGLDLRAVVTESVSNVVHEGNGLYSVEVEFLEYRPPPPVSAVSTPTGAGDQTRKDAKTPPGPMPDPALAAADKALADAISDAKALGKP